MLNARTASNKQFTPVSSPTTTQTLSTALLKFQVGWLTDDQCRMALQLTKEALIAHRFARVQKLWHLDEVALTLDILEAYHHWAQSDTPQTHHRALASDLFSEAETLLRLSRINEDAEYRLGLNNLLEIAGAKQREWSERTASEHEAAIGFLSQHWRRAVRDLAGGNAEAISADTVSGLRTLSRLRQLKSLMKDVVLAEVRQSELPRE